MYIYIFTCNAGDESEMLPPCYHSAACKLFRKSLMRRIYGSLWPSGVKHKHSGNLNIWGNSIYNILETSGNVSIFLGATIYIYIVLYAYLPMPLQLTISQTIFGQPRQSFRSGEERITLNAHWRRTALVAEWILSSFMYMHRMYNMISHYIYIYVELLYSILVT